jgi:hypothetical protein
VSFSNKSLIRVLLASSLVLGGITPKLVFGGATASTLQKLPSSSQSNVSTDFLKLSLFQTENKNFATRIEALNAVKDRGPVPTSQSFISQWENGNDKVGGAHHYFYKGN